MSERRIAQDEKENRVRLRGSSGRMKKEDELKITLSGTGLASLQHHAAIAFTD